jgi:pimeloyl-ACP methyl ester carboxylesterase
MSIQFESPADMRRAPNGTAYVEAGDGEPVVLLHGVGLTARMWFPVIEQLALSHRVIAPDLLGHGESPLPTAEALIADYSEQVAALLRHLGIDTARVVGFSMGAMVAQRFAIDHPLAVAKLVLVCAVHDRSTEEKLAVRTRALSTAIRGIAPSVPAALERWFTPSFAAQQPEVIESVRATLLANDSVGYLRSYAVFATADESLKDEIGRITAPTLIVAGDDDIGSTPQMAATLHERIRGSEVLVLPGARHMLPLELPVRLAALLEAFFSDQSLRTSGAAG